MTSPPAAGPGDAAESALRSAYAARPENGALLTDLYQLNMIQGYLETGMTEPAAFVSCSVLLR